ncbi:hypothetical protein A8C75_13820 [Marinobacterium aestuarii]|uniref:Metallo-beta-lactamase domain-containing protein n=2 Tax=Marinobacterium aestuarii TaxID=1821621 RepID=A0A1A9F027_9GAMM|nr:hypothetical protein A8C75_13820 [Marinobacterium aestuarii]
MPLVAPSHDAQKMQEKGFSALTSRAWNESVSYQAGAGTVTFTAVLAHHSGDASIDPLLGLGNGYWIDVTQGDWKKTLYWTGDTLAAEDVIQAVRARGPLDILMPHLGRVGTPGPLGKISMGADAAVQLARALSPTKVVPIHHSSYVLYLEPIDRLVTQSQGAHYGLDLISEGSRLLYR